MAAGVLDGVEEVPGFRGAGGAGELVDNLSELEGVGGEEAKGGQSEEELDGLGS